MAKFLTRRPANLTLAWEQVSPTKTGTHEPSWVGYTTAVYDAVSGKSLWYLPRSPNTIIYGTDMFAYDAGDRTWTWLGGTGKETNPGSDGSAAVNSAGSPISPWPSDRHPIEQMAVDAFRGHLYLSRGVAGGVSPEDLWRYTLNANPTANTWESLSLPTVPSIGETGSMVYVASHDILVMHGTNSGSFPRTYVYALGSGASSTKQLAAGCSSRHQWFQTYAPGSVLPAHSAFSSLVSIPNTGKVLHFGHYEPAGEVWEYDIEAKTWTNLNPANQPSEPDTWTTPERSFTCVPSGPMRRRVIYHQTSHTSGSSFAADWVYDRETNRWSTLPSTGTGPDVLATQVFDPTLGSYGGIVAWTFGSTMWHGVLQ